MCLQCDFQGLARAVFATPREASSTPASPTPNRRSACRRVADWARFLASSSNLLFIPFLTFCVFLCFCVADCERDRSISRPDPAEEDAVLICSIRLGPNGQKIAAD